MPFHACLINKCDSKNPIHCQAWLYNVSLNNFHYIKESCRNATNINPLLKPDPYTCLKLTDSPSIYFVICTSIATILIYKWKHVSTWKKLEGRLIQETLYFSHNPWWTIAKNRNTDRNMLRVKITKTQMWNEISQVTTCICTVHLPGNNHHWEWRSLYYTGN